MADGIFRRKNGFTVVQNQIARDNNISLKAKGLYLVIQSYITMPDVTWKKSDFEKFSTDGRRSFDTSWTELRDAGYIKWHRVYVKSTGKFRDEFELLDEPKEGPYGYFYNKDGELSSTKGNVILKQMIDVNSVQSEETPHHTRFDVDGNDVDENDVHGTDVDGNHIDGNVGDNYKDSNNNNSDYKDFGLLSHQVSSSEDSVSEQGQDRTGLENAIPIVVLDQTVPVEEEEVYNIHELLKESNGIPYHWKQSPERMTKAIQVLAGWNDVVQYGFDGRRDQEKEAIYACMVKNLIEMCLAPENIRVGDNRVVSYAKVIDQINCIYHTESIKEHALSMFFDRCVERFKEATIRTKIHKIDDYCRPLLWNALSTYSMDWHGYFNRTYYGDWSN